MHHGLKINEGYDKYDGNNNSFMHIDNEYTSLFNEEIINNVFFKYDRDKTDFHSNVEFFTTDDMIIQTNRDSDHIMIHRTTPDFTSTDF
jgi:hypothetical protein